MSAKAKAKVSGNKTSASLNDDFKTVDFSIPIGVSYEFPMGLILDARYNIGVANVAEGGGKTRNNFISVTAGFRF